MNTSLNIKIIRLLGICRIAVEAALPTDKAKAVRLLIPAEYLISKGPK